MRFQAQALQAPPRIVHACRTCGITSDDAPHMQFRYCSKCDGDSCYCPAHLREHEHVVTQLAGDSERAARSAARRRSELAVPIAVRQQQRIEKCDRSARLHRVGFARAARRAIPAAAAYGGSVRQRLTKASSCSASVRPYGGVGRGECGDDVAEVPRVGAERDGGAVGGGLDHVLAAAVAETAADKGDLGGAPPGAEFADGVDEQDLQRVAGSSDSEPPVRHWGLA